MEPNTEESTFPLRDEGIGNGPPVETDEPKVPNLVPPDHPLLQKFQDMLKEYLTRTKISLTDEIAELKYELKQKQAEHDEEGAKLYDLQQDLKRQNEQLEAYAEEMEAITLKRQEMDETVTRLKGEYETHLSTVKKQKQLYNKRMVELDNITILEGNIRQWTEEIEDEVKNAKRTVNRDTQMQRQLSEEKKKSDMLFYQLDMEVKNSERELEIMQNEVQEMRRINELLKSNINDANTDLQMLENENKRLTQAWGEVIVAITHRDKFLFQVQQAINKEQETIKLNARAIEAIKKQSANEKKMNEKLEAFKTRLLADLGHQKREYQKQSEAFQALENKLEELPLWLTQNEKDLAQATQEGNDLETQIRHLQWKIDQESSKKVNIEELILKTAQEQLISDKASQYRLKLLHQAQSTRRQMQLTLAQAKNQLMNALLDVEQLKRKLFQMSTENDQLNDKLTQSEQCNDNVNAEVATLDTQLEIKLKKVDRLSSRIEELKRCGVESGVESLIKKIKLVEESLLAGERQIREYQQAWLKLQDHQVNLSEKRNQQRNEIQIAQNQLSIIKQKSLKIDIDLEIQEAFTKELERDIKVFLTKLEILNGKMHKAAEEHSKEENECELEHAKLLDKLKENEMQVLNLEREIVELQNEIDEYKDVVLEKNREALSWETKYKLIEETLRWRKDEQSQTSEMAHMKAEIHRMKIRYQQLARAQEKLTQDLQHGIKHREHIFAAASAKKIAELKGQRMKSGITQQQNITELRNRLKKVQVEINNVKKNQLAVAEREREGIRAERKRLESEIQQEKERHLEIQQKLYNGALEKLVNLERIVRKQNRAKAYRRLRCSPAPKMPRSEAILSELMQKQIEINDNLYDVVQTLSSEFPERKNLFEKITHILRD